MTKVIHKLGKLVNPESFIQINTIKGFKYVDKAGEIVNYYHSHNTPPVFNMNLDGLVIQKPRKNIELLKVTSQSIWMKFLDPDSLDLCISLFVKEIEHILSILQVEKISRVGWRNYFIHEFTSEQNQQSYLGSLLNIKDNRLLLAQFEIITKKDFNATLSFQPVTKNDPKTTPGVLFDIDIFLNGDIEPENIASILKDFKQYLSDESGFLSVINNTFKEA